MTYLAIINGTQVNEQYWARMYLYQNYLVYVSCDELTIIIDNVEDSNFRSREQASLESIALDLYKKKNCND